MKHQMTDKQKQKMREGRQRAAAKRREGLVTDIEPVKKVQKEEIIIGFGFEKGDDLVVPVFRSEKHTFKGPIFDTAMEAKEAFDDRKKRKAN